MSGEANQIGVLIALCRGFTWPVGYGTWEVVTSERVLLATLC